MGDFSRSPGEVLADSLAKGYVGVHIEQGVPLLDRDLNLLQDLVAAVTRSIVTRHIGSGIAAGHDGFRIAPAGVFGEDNDFQILAGPSGGPGVCLVDGIEVVIDKPITYKSQGLEDLSIPPGDNPDLTRTDAVYLDVWLTEVDDGELELLNQDVGMRTSVRVRPAWAVRVAEDHADAPDPEPGSGHAHLLLATLARRVGESTILAPQIIDRRRQRLTLTDLERRVQEIERLRLLPEFTATEFSPPVGAPDTPVKLNGFNFDVGVPTVKFGNKTAKLDDIPTAVGVTALVPGGLPPGNVPVSVTTRAGTAVSRNTFNVLGSRPRITSFNPAKGKPETSSTAPATEVMITGEHFDENIDEETTVAFGQVPAKIKRVTATTIVFFVPPVDSGEHTITVTTQWGAADSPTRFTVFQGIPS